jgi:hypothetical protein
MNATLGQIKLRNLFLRIIFFKMQPNALLAWQNFIMQKVGVTNLPPPPKRNLALEIQKHWEKALGNLLRVLLHAHRLLHIQCGDSIVLCTS